LLLKRLLTANSESALDQEHEQHNYPVLIEEERELAWYTYYALIDCSFLQWILSFVFL